MSKVKVNIHMPRKERRSIDYIGDRCASELATWGQQAIWEDLSWRWSDAYRFSLGRSIPIPAGHSITSVLNVLAKLVSRFESLRTRFTIDSDGHLRQHVDSSGTFFVDFWESLPQEDYDPTADIMSDFEAAVIDHSVSIPIRFSATVIEGEPETLLIFASHLAMDAHAMSIVTDFLKTALGADGPLGISDYQGLQPIDVAREELSEVGQRRKNRSLRYWRSKLDAMPQTMLPQASAPAEGTRYWMGAIDSAKMASATEAIAEKLGVSTTTVLLAAIAVANAKTAQTELSYLRIVSSNRFSDRARDSVLTASMYIPVLIDVNCATFDEVVLRTWTSCLTAYRNSQYDPLSAKRITQEVERERGVALDTACVSFNDRRIFGKQNPENPETGFRWVECYERDDLKLNFLVSGSSDLLTLNLAADTNFLSRREIRSILTGLEDFLVLAAGEGLK